MRGGFDRHVVGQRGHVGEGDRHVARFGRKRFLSYFSCPSGFAASASAPLGAVLEDADVVGAAVVVAAGALAVEAVEAVVPLEELPQPASASTPSASVRAESVLIVCVGFAGFSFMRSAPW